jgi:membrane protease YdiL (CAAX protease family)
MGKWAPVVIILAIIWLIFGICILTIPAEFHEATLVNGAIVVIGVVLYFAYFKWTYAKKAASEVAKEVLFHEDTASKDKSIQA